MASEAVTLSLLACLILASPVRSFCPSMCQCDDDRLEASCSGARLDSVPILLNPSLRSLHLAHNRIASLRQSVSFYGELRRLDLSHNVLHSLGLLHFQPLGQLQWLNVSNNLISSLEPESFSGLVSLAVLDLSANRLTRLTDDLFHHLPSLTALILSANKIQTVAGAAFDSLRHLRSLHLDDNNLGRVPSDALVPLAASLQTLSLSKNLIEALDDGAFRPLARLQRLKLNDNAVSRVDRLAFDSLVSLEALDLSFNRLDGPVAAFSASTAVGLTSLDLSGNMWRQLPASFLCAFARLQTLNISYMEYLRSVDPSVLRCPSPAGGNGTTSKMLALPLVHLVMTNNALWNHLPPTLFNGLENHLVRLDLSGNAFETLQLDVQDGHGDGMEEGGGSRWPHLRHLNVAYNPLECNCSLLWLWQMLHGPANDPTGQHTTIVNVTCSGPAPFSGSPLATLSQSDLHCSLALSVSLLAVLVVLWLLLVAALVVVILFWRRRRQTRRESRLVMIKSTGVIHDPFQHQHQQLASSNGPSPVLMAKHYRLDNTAVHHLSNGHGSSHYYQQQTTLAPASVQHYGQHQQYYGYGQQPARDEYHTYHCAGTMKRIPVTVV